MSGRLDEGALSRLPGAVRAPGYRRQGLRPRMVHIGVGAFHRAHQAVYTDDAIEACGGGWGVTGLSLRSPTAARQLSPQDGLYGVATRSGDGEAYRVVGNLLRVVTAPDDPTAAMSALTDEGVSVVTLTITEKGYGLDPATGTLDLDDEGIAHDLAAPYAPRSAIGLLAEAIRRRRDQGSPPLTLVSCDNLPENGARLSGALTQYAERLDPSLARHIEGGIACPQTMVDRIVPATAASDIARAEAVLGVRDEGLVVTEPFRQWVIEDRFAGPRPAWDAAGVTITDDVRAFETAKLRLLNGAHSAIAYLGDLAGIRCVHEAMADQGVSAFVARLMDDEIMPTVPEPPGLPLACYAETLRARFRNPALDHETAQIAKDGSRKLPQRILAPVRDRLAGGRPIPRLALVVAAWMVHATRIGIGGRRPDVSDPLSDRLTALGKAHGGDIEGLVRGVCGLPDVFGHDLPRDEHFVRAVADAAGTLLAEGPRSAAMALAG